MYVLVGPRFNTTDGVETPLLSSGLISSTTVGQVYVDGGATARDAHNGDVSPLLVLTVGDPRPGVTPPTVSGHAITLDTSRPTAASAPVIINYTLPANSVPEVYVDFFATRQLSVVCQPGFVSCADPSPSAPSGALLCQLPSACSLGVPLAQNLTAALPGALTVPAPALPTITLLGPARTVSNAGSAYVACPANTPLDSNVTCDHGATASDPIDGDLTNLIEACGSGSPGVVGSSTALQARFAAVGISACHLPPGTPGIYNVTFSVTNSRGLTASVIRTVVIQGACIGPTMSVDCNLNACLTSGGNAFNCLGGFDGSGTGAVASAGAATRALDLLTNLVNAYNPPAPTAPTITLITTSALPTTVNIPQGTGYGVCAPGQVPLTSKPCELGATARDLYGNNLTSAVLACPPSSCLSLGCPTYFFSSVGLSACPGLSTLASAPEGTTLTITFTVFTNTTPPGSASVSRILRVVSPCPSGQQLCNGVCMAASCTTLSLLAKAFPGVGNTTGSSVTPNITVKVKLDVKGITPVSLLVAQAQSSAGAVSGKHRLLLSGSSPYAVSSSVQSHTSVRHPTQHAVPAQSHHKQKSGTPSGDPRSGRAESQGQQHRALALRRVLLQSSSSTNSVSASALAPILGDVLVDDLGSVFYSPVGGALPFSLTPCLKGQQPSPLGSTSSSNRCGVTATDASGNDISDALISADVSSLSVTNTPAGPIHVPCGTQAADKGQCLPGMYNITYAVSDSAGRTASLSVMLNLEHRLSTTLRLVTRVRCSSLSPSALAAQLAGSQSFLTGVITSHLPALGMALSRLRRVTISGISVTPVTASGGSLCDAALSLDVHMACLDGDQFPPSFASLPNIATLLGLYSSQASIASSSNSSATPTGRRRLSSSFNELDDEAAYDMLEADGYGNYDRAPLQVMASSSSDNNYEAATMQLVGTSKQRALLQASGSCICPTLNTTTLQAAQAAAAASTTDINSVPVSGPGVLVGASLTMPQGCTVITAALNESFVQNAMLLGSLETVIAQDARLQLFLGGVQSGQGAPNNISPLTTTQAYGYDMSAWLLTLQQMILSMCKVLDLPTCGGNPFSLDLSQLNLQGTSGSGDYEEAALADPNSDRTCLEARNPLIHFYFQVNDHSQAGEGSSEVEPRVRGTLIDPGNQLIAGLLLHQVRKEEPEGTPALLPYKPSGAACSSRFAGTLVPACTEDAFESILLDAVYQRTGLNASQRAAAGLPSIGIDPTFLLTSRLYNSDLAIKDWYNTSDPFTVNYNGVPYGFTPVALPGRPAGYPLLLSVDLSEARVPEILQYIRDGQYLDHQRTQQLTVQAATFNRNRRAYGLWTAVLDWADGGGISAVFTVSVLTVSATFSGSLPARGDTLAIMQMAVDLVLVALVGIHMAVWSWEFSGYLKHHWSVALAHLEHKVADWLEKVHDKWESFTHHEHHDHHPKDDDRHSVGDQHQGDGESGDGSGPDSALVGARGDRRTPVPGAGAGVERSHQSLLKVLRGQGHGDGHGDRDRATPGVERSKASIMKALKQHTIGEGPNHHERATPGVERSRASLLMLLKQQNGGDGNGVRERSTPGAERSHASLLKVLRQVHGGGSDDSEEHEPERRATPGAHRSTPAGAAGAGLHPLSAARHSNDYDDSLDEEEEEERQQRQGGASNNSSDDDSDSDTNDSDDDLPPLPAAPASPSARGLTRVGSGQQRRHQALTVNDVFAAKRVATSLRRKRPSEAGSASGQPPLRPSGSEGGQAQVRWQGGAIRASDSSPQRRSLQQQFSASPRSSAGAGPVAEALEVVGREGSSGHGGADAVASQNGSPSSPAGFHLHQALRQPSLALSQSSASMRISASSVAVSVHSELFGSGSLLPRLAPAALMSSSSKNLKMTRFGVSFGGLPAGAPGEGGLNVSGRLASVRESSLSGRQASLTANRSAKSMTEGMTGSRRKREPKLSPDHELLPSLRSHSVRIAHAGSSLHALRKEAKKEAKMNQAGGPRVRFKPPSVSGLELLYDGLTTAVMLAAVVTLVVYSTTFTSGKLPDASRYNVYDADAFAPARFFMPKRLLGTPSLSSSSLNATSTEALPGNPGRWAAGLGDDISGLEQVSNYYVALKTLENVSTWYGLLQCAALLLLLMRLLALASVQPRLALIPETLKAAAPALGHLMGVFLPVFAMSSAALTVCFGVAVDHAASIDTALAQLFFSLVTADTSALQASFRLAAPGIMAHPLQASLISIIPVLVIFFVHMMVATWVVAALLDIFQPLRESVATEISLFEEVSVLLRWQLQSLVGAPSSARLHRLMVILNAKPVVQRTMATTRIVSVLRAMGSKSATWLRGGPAPIRSALKGSSMSQGNLSSTSTTLGKESINSTGKKSNWAKLRLPGSFSSRVAALPLSSTTPEASSSKGGSGSGSQQEVMKGLHSPSMNGSGTNSSMDLAPSFRLGRRSEAGDSGTPTLAAPGRSPSSFLPAQRAKSTTDSFRRISFSRSANLQSTSFSVFGGSRPQLGSSFKGSAVPDLETVPSGPSLAQRALKTQSFTPRGSASGQVSALGVRRQSADLVPRPGRALLHSQSEHDASTRVSHSNPGLLHPRSGLSRTTHSGALRPSPPAGLGPTGGLFVRPCSRASGRLTSSPAAAGSPEGSSGNSRAQSPDSSRRLRTGFSKQHLLQSFSNALSIARSVTATTPMATAGSVPPPPSPHVFAWGPPEQAHAHLNQPQLSGAAVLSASPFATVSYQLGSSPPWSPTLLTAQPSPELRHQTALGASARDSIDLPMQVGSLPNHLSGGELSPLLSTSPSPAVSRLQNVFSGALKASSSLRARPPTQSLSGVRPGSPAARAPSSPAPLGLGAGHKGGLTIRTRATSSSGTPQQPRASPGGGMLPTILSRPAPSSDPVDLDTARGTHTPNPQAVDQTAAALGTDSPRSSLNPSARPSPDRTSPFPPALALAAGTPAGAPHARVPQLLHVGLEPPSGSWPDGVHPRLSAASCPGSSMGGAPSPAPARPSLESLGLLGSPIVSPRGPPPAGRVSMSNLRNNPGPSPLRSINSTQPPSRLFQTSLPGEPPPANPETAQRAALQQEEPQLKPTSSASLPQAPSFISARVRMSLDGKARMSMDGEGRVRISMNGEARSRMSMDGEARMRGSMSGSQQLQPRDSQRGSPLAGKSAKAAAKKKAAALIHLESNLRSLLSKGSKLDGSSVAAAAAAAVAAVDGKKGSRRQSNPGDRGRMSMDGGAAAGPSLQNRISNSGGSASPGLAVTGRRSYNGERGSGQLSHVASLRPGGTGSAILRSRFAPNVPSTAGGDASRGGNGRGLLSPSSSAGRDARVSWAGSGSDGSPGPSPSLALQKKRGSQGGASLASTSPPLTPGHSLPLLTTSSADMPGYADSSVMGTNLLMSMHMTPILENSAMASRASGELGGAASTSTAREGRSAHVSLDLGTRDLPQQALNPTSQQEQGTYKAAAPLTARHSQHRARVALRLLRRKAKELAAATLAQATIMTAEIATALAEQREMIALIERLIAQMLARRPARVTISAPSRPTSPLLPSPFAAAAPAVLEQQDETETSNGAAVSTPPRERLSTKFSTPIRGVITGIHSSSPGPSSPFMTVQMSPNHHHGSPTSSASPPSSSPPLSPAASAHGALKLWPLGQEPSASTTGSAGVLLGSAKKPSFKSRLSKSSMPVPDPADPQQQQQHTSEAGTAVSSAGGEHGSGGADAGASTDAQDTADTLVEMLRATWAQEAATYTTAWHDHTPADMAADTSSHDDGGSALMVVAPASPCEPLTFGTNIQQGDGTEHDGGLEYDDVTDLDAGSDSAAGAANSATTFAVSSPINLSVYSSVANGHVHSEASGSVMLLPSPGLPPIITPRQQQDVGDAAPPTGNIPAAMTQQQAEDIILAAKLSDVQGEASARAGGPSCDMAHSHQLPAAAMSPDQAPTGASPTQDGTSTEGHNTSHQVSFQEALKWQGSGSVSNSSNAGSRASGSQEITPQGLLPPAGGSGSSRLGPLGSPRHHGFGFGHAGSGDVSPRLGLGRLGSGDVSPKTDYKALQERALARAAAASARAAEVQQQQQQQSPKADK